jgi:hypothetical protein
LTHHIPYPSGAHDIENHIYDTNPDEDITCPFCSKLVKDDMVIVVAHAKCMEQLRHTDND